MIGDTYYVFTVIVLIVILALLGIGLGLGDGERKEKNNSNATSEDADDKETETTKPEKKENIKESSAETITIKVSVFENDYFYQNKKISIDGFIKELKNINNEFVVEITDDNASLKAYKTLLEMLKENSIHYTEK